MHRSNTFGGYQRTQGLQTSRAVKNTHLGTGFLHIFNIFPLDFDSPLTASFSPLSLDSSCAAQGVFVNIFPLNVPSADELKNIPYKMMFVRR